MIVFKNTATSQLYLNGCDDWELQLKKLKESFNDFCLLSYKYKIKNGLPYNVFKFSHEIYINFN